MLRQLVCAYTPKKLKSCLAGIPKEKSPAAGRTEGVHGVGTAGQVERKFRRILVCATEPAEIPKRNTRKGDFAERMLPVKRIIKKNNSGANKKPGWFSPGFCLRKCLFIYDYFLFYFLYFPKNFKNFTKAYKILQIFTELFGILNLSY
jgi:hypothetical protein